MIELGREGLGAEQVSEKVIGGWDMSTSRRWGWLEGGARSSAVTTGKAGQEGWMAELIAQGRVREASARV